MKQSIKFSDYRRSASRRSKLGRKKSKAEANKSFVFAASTINCSLIRELKKPPSGKREKLREWVRRAFQPGPDEIVYLGEAYVEALHAVLVIDYADTDDPIRDPGILHHGNFSWICSEVRYLHNEPKTTEGKIKRKAAFLLYHLTSKHPFVDGNKRTALVTTNAFLEWNRFSISRSLGSKDYRHVEEFLVLVADNKRTEEDCYRFINKHIQPIVQWKRRRKNKVVALLSKMKRKVKRILRR
jgi:death-on-curing family protein